MKFAGVSLDTPKVMGVINVSPESFFKGSVKRGEELIETAVRMVEEGAAFIDIGAKSTAPYLETEIPVEEEIRRAVEAIRAIRDAVDVPISIDTTNAKVAEEAIKAGADIVNDVTGLKGDPEMVKVVKEYDVPVVICAHQENVRNFSDPVHEVIDSLKESLQIAYKNGIEKENIAIDPAIGFFRPEYPPWYVWDSKVIANLKLLKVFGLPILVGISRKSFIGAITGREDPSERLEGSLAATAIAVLNGANIIRAHDVKETLDVIKVADFIRRFTL
ncbi:dihydropteroate synthase [Pyrococcus furiosus DSM 3638]|uniref:dihydropteroate synthase n=3 Tax=Pyrococcus furiosus TaxID=2261 RepID=A0A5C0XPY3_PYRFU|nr:dihydropteroate synthase [Pyrococcus furiosus]AAL81420.1 dihydropteroate synthase [Pyrococcus furiosus DSM 3638]AFN04080.1 dihydropteroate synthase [Pyrococcus furiosus COM1]QEK78937.1 dihydropteroate synthase [Pyrococcus furiosus DSM 3638]